MKKIIDAIVFSKSNLQRLSLIRELKNVPRSPHFLTRRKSAAATARSGFSIGEGAPGNRGGGKNAFFSIQTWNFRLEVRKFVLYTTATIMAPIFIFLCLISLGWAAPNQDVGEARENGVISKTILLLYFSIFTHRNFFRTSTYFILFTILHI